MMSQRALTSSLIFPQGIRVVQTAANNQKIMMNSD